MCPVLGVDSEDVAEHDPGLVAARSLRAGVAGREVDVLVGVGGVDLGAEGAPEVPETSRETAALQGRHAVPAIRVPADQHDPRADRQPGAGAVLTAEVI